MTSPPTACGFCGKRARLTDWIRYARAWWAS